MDSHDSPKRARAIMYEIYEKQRASGKIPELERTRKRLLKMSYSKEDTKKLICQCIATEIYSVLKGTKTI